LQERDIVLDGHRPINITFTLSCPPNAERG
jgi:hypothetical protein